MTYASLITSQNVDRESYYNCLQLCRITGYADPIAALKATDETVSVQRDACGNITSGSLQTHTVFIPDSMPA